MRGVEVEWVIAERLGRHHAQIKWSSRNEDHGSHGSTDKKIEWLGIIVVPGSEFGQINPDVQ